MRTMAWTEEDAVALIYLWTRDARVAAHQARQYVLDRFKRLPRGVLRGFSDTARVEVARTLVKELSVPPPLHYEVVKLSLAGGWGVEAIDYASEGECYTTQFYGPDAEQRAREYADIKNGLAVTVVHDARCQACKPSRQPRSSPYTRETIGIPFPGEYGG